MSSNLIAKACSEEYDQPQGFVLNQLAKATVGDPRECEAIVSELMKKLDRSSPDIKFKALRTLKYLCMNGRSEVRLMLQSEHVNEIKKCLQFRAPPDPLRGDAPSQRVRDEAKDTLHTLYNYSQQQHATPVGRIEGYGVSEPTASSPSPSDSYSFNPVIPPSPYANNAQTYQGTYSTPQLHDTASSKYTGYGSDGAHQPSQPHLIDKLRSKANNNNNNSAPFRPYQYPSAYSTNELGANASSSSTTDSSTTARTRGQVGGMWASAPATSSSLTNNNSSNSRPTFGDSSSSTTSSSSSSSSSQPTGEYETRLVELVCASSGVRSQPTKEELTKFETQAASLNKLQLVALLNDKTASNQPWMTQMKALCYLELLLSSPLLVAACDQLCDFLCDNATNLQQLEQSPQMLVRNKCIRVQELAGLREEQVANTSTSAANSGNNHFASQPQKHQQQQTLDLLNFVPPATSSTSNSSSSGTASSSLNLLDSLQTNSSVDDASNLFGNLNIAQRDHVTNNGGITNNNSSHNNSTGDSFSFIHNSTPSTVKPTVSSFSSSSGLDPFAGLTSKTSSASSSSSSNVPSSSSSTSSSSSLSSSSSDPFASLTGLAGGSSLTNSNSGGGLGGGIKKIDPVTFLLATSKPSTSAHLINAPYAPHHHHHHHHHYHHHQHHHHHQQYHLQHPLNSQYPSVPLTSSQPLNFTVRPASNDGRLRGNIDDLSLMPSISSSTSASNSSAAASGAFGFVNETKRDEFGFVTDMMKS